MDQLQLAALSAWCSSSNEGVLIVDRAGTICAISERLKQMLQLERTPQTVQELLTWASGAPSELRAIFENADKLAHAQWGTFRLQRRPVLRVTWEQKPLHDAAGNLVGTLTILRDAADQGQLEVVKHSFLGMISHDLRTPLSNIVGFADLLNQSGASFSVEEQKEFIQHIVKNANDLNRYTQIALDILFLEANIESFDVEPIVLPRFIKSWLSDAWHRFPPNRLVFKNGVEESKTVANAAAPALHKILHILAEFALEETTPNDQVVIRLEHDQSQAHVVVEYRAPDLDGSSAIMLFRLMHPRDLSQAGRPNLSRMQLYVATLLAERQQGYLTMSGRPDQRYQMHLVLPLAPQLAVS